jgi:predicted metalloprotease with PDZ domain
MSLPRVARFALALLAACAMLPAAGIAADADERRYRVDYTIELIPERKEARVAIAVDSGRWLKRVNMRIDPKRQYDLKADGRLALEGGRAIWQVPAKGGTLRLTAKIDHQRESGAYDAYMTPRWAIFRGDDLVPSARVRAIKGARSIATLRFKLPLRWAADTGWPSRDDRKSFQIDDLERSFDRPVGWMIAGEIGIRRDFIGRSEVAVAAPDGSDMQRMDVLSFLNVIWPQAESAFGRMPRKFLVIGGDDPLWRGGLSSPNSIFFHSARPLVSGNATSSLAHELMHVATRIRARKQDDWITEGLAEFYSIELMYRAGAISDTRYQKTREWLAHFGRKVTTLRTSRAQGPVMARAALLFQDLDREIRKRTGDERDIDDVTRALMKKRKVAREDLIAAAEKVASGRLETLRSPLIR